MCRVQPLFTRSLINQKLAVAIKIFNFTKNIYNSPLCWIMKRMCSAAARWWLLGMQQQPAVTVYREGTLWPPTVLQSTIRRVSSVCRDNRPGHCPLARNMARCDQWVHGALWPGWPWWPGGAGAGCGKSVTFLAFVLVRRGNINQYLLITLHTTCGDIYYWQNDDLLIFILTYIGENYSYQYLLIYRN